LLLPGTFIRALPIPPAVNQPFTLNVAPAVSFDGKKMVFLSDRDGKWLLYECTRMANKWSDPAPVEVINRWAGDSKISSPYLNYNGKQLYFASDKGGLGGLDIYVSEYDGGKWKEPENLGEPVNTAADEEWPSLSLNGQTMYFTRTQAPLKGKEICSTLFRTVKNNNVWQQPLELRNPINQKCSKAPRLCADGKTLFFSSNRNAEDRFEIFYTSEVLPDVWLIPQPVQLSGTEETDVLSLSVDPNRQTVYAEQSLLNARKPRGSIVELPLPAQFQPECLAFVYGKVTDMFSGNPLPAKIEVSDLNTFEVNNLVFNDPQTGEYMLMLPKHREYKLDVYHESTSHFYFTCDTRNLATDIEVTQDVKLSTYVQLLLNVYDRTVFTPLDVKLTVTDSITGSVIQQISAGNADGRYQTRLPIGKNYLLLFEKEHYEPYRFPFDMHKVVQFLEYERDVMMEVGTTETEITVTDALTGEDIEGVEIVINNLHNNEQIVINDKDAASGKYNTRLRKGDSYEVKVNAPKGYAYYYTKVTINDANFTGTIEAKLSPLLAQTHITLNNISFETNSADLNESSYQELENLLKLMRDNPQISIEISAHTDNVGSVPYNNRLSEKRATTVVDYMLEHAIPFDRITAKGYGSSQPVVPNTSEENRALNRRVEFKIINVQKE
jgi:outer membrane protein OmpA-like peptidoglycan-associated protein